VNPITIATAKAEEEIESADFYLESKYFGTLIHDDMEP
jgi:hypothetical protein